jgi:hypothetical protein
MSSDSATAIIISDPPNINSPLYFTGASEFDKAMNLWAQQIKGQIFVQSNVGNSEFAKSINSDFKLIEQSISGFASIPVDGLSSYTLTANNGTEDEARCAVYQFTGALTADCTVDLPAVPKIAWATNASSANYKIILRNENSAGRTSELPHYQYYPQMYTLVVSDGVNIDQPVIYSDQGFVSRNVTGGYGFFDSTFTYRSTVFVDASYNTILSNVGSTGTRFYITNRAKTIYYSLDDNGITTLAGSDQAPINNKVGGIRILANGAIDQYTTSTVNGVHNMGVPTGGSSFCGFFYNGANPVGSITTNGTTTSFNTTSDYRLKETFGPYPSSDDFDKIKVYDGRWLNLFGGDTVHSLQPLILAHELAEVFPFAVSGEKDAVTDEGTIKPQQVDFLSLIPALISEIQSLRSRLARLEAK